MAHDKAVPARAYLAEYAPCSQPHHAGLLCLRVHRNDQPRTPEPRAVCQPHQIDDLLADVPEKLARVYSMSECACKFFPHA